MNKTAFVILFTFLVVLACKKEESTPAQNPFNINGIWLYYKASVINDRWNINPFPTAKFSLISDSISVDASSNSGKNILTGSFNLYNEDTTCWIDYTLTPAFYAGKKLKIHFNKRFDNDSLFEYNGFMHAIVKIVNNDSIYVFNHCCREEFALVRNN